MRKHPCSSEMCRKPMLASMAAERAATCTQPDTRPADRPGHRRQLQRAETDMYLARLPVKEGAFGKILSPPRPAARIDHRCAVQPRHALFVCGVRSRCGPCDDHVARCRQALHVADGDQRGPLRPRDRLHGRRSRLHAREDRHTISLCSGAHARRSGERDDDQTGASPAGRDHDQQPGGTAASRCRTGIRSARRRCATRCWCSTRPSRPASGLRRKGRGRSGRHLIGTASAWGPTQTKMRSISTSRHEERRQDGLRLTVRERTGRTLLVGHRLRRHRHIRRRTVQRLLLQQRHGEEERRRLRYDPVRRLRRQGRQLPAPSSRLELHGAALSSATRILNGTWTFPDAEATR